MAPIHASTDSCLKGMGSQAQSGVRPARGRGRVPRPFIIQRLETQPLGALRSGHASGCRP